MFKNLKKLWSVFTVKHKNSLFLIVFLIVLTSLLEIVGISLILPILSLLTDNSLFDNHLVLRDFIYKYIGTSKELLIIFGFLFISFVYLIKFLTLVFAYWYLSKFVHNLKFFLQKKLFSNYLNSNYEFHIQGNSAFFIKNISLESSNIINNVLSPLIIIFTECLLIIGITVFILFLEPLGGTVLIIYIFLSIFFFQNFTKNKLKKISEIRALNDGFRYKSIVEGFNGIKDIKLLGKEDSFINKFKFYAKKSFDAEQKYYFLSQIPRVWLEFICIAGLTLLIIITILKSNSVDQIIPIVGVFAFAAFRILPLSNRVLNSIQQVRFGKISLDIYLKELELTDTLTKNSENVDLNFKNEIHLQNISYSYPKSKSESVKNINLKIKKGELLGIIGKSGSGKTTIIDIILGLLYPTTGTISIDKNLIDTRNLIWRSLFGYVQQDIFLIDDSLKKNIALGVAEEEINYKNLQYAINSAQLSNFVDSLPLKVETNVGEKGVKISGGQRQRIAIARALYFRPSVLILDEATSALDIETEKNVMESISNLKGKCTIIIISHRLSILDNCDRVFKLEKDKLEIID